MKKDKNKVKKIILDLRCIGKMCRCFDILKKTAVVILLLLGLVAIKDTLPVLADLKNKKKLSDFFSDFFRA